MYQHISPLTLYDYSFEWPDNHASIESGKQSSQQTLNVDEADDHSISQSIIGAEIRHAKYSFQPTESPIGVGSNFGTPPFHPSDPTTTHTMVGTPDLTFFML